jgi:multiple sugar transport system permease protein
VVLQVIASLKIFEQIYLITAGGPNYATRSAIEFIYDTGFTRVSYASAASLALFVVILIVSFIWLFLIRKQERGV